MSSHPYKIVRWGTQEFRIDEDIAPMIRGLWKLGIQTISSCQGSCMGWCNKKHRSRLQLQEDGTYVPQASRCRGSVAIAFAQTADAARFMSVVLQNLWHHESKKDRNRFLKKETRIKSFGVTNKNWIWKPWFRDFHHDFTPAPTKQPVVHFAMLVVFPRSDIKFVTESVQQALAKKRKK